MARNDSSASDGQYPFPMRLIAKLRGKGLLWFWRKRVIELTNRISAVGTRCRRRWKSFCGYVKQLARFICWLFPAVGGIASSGKLRQRRLLLIYDLSVQPFSIGDILLMQEAALVLRQKHGLGLVDFAFVYDPEHPASSDPAFSAINRNNAIHNLSHIMGGVQVNDRLGSLFIFNPPSQLHRFIADNIESYYIWPSAWQSRKYVLWDVFNELLYEHFREHGTVPQLSCPSFLKGWAADYYSEHVTPMIPVTVQARNNRDNYPLRNIKVECWLKLFEYCIGRRPVKFVIICAADEIDERMRKYPNVVIAKDKHTSVAQDIALIQSSAMHMGVASGPSLMAVFNSNPYFFIAYNGIPYAHRGIIAEVEGRFRMPFATPFQRWTTERETTEMLISEFERMWSTVDVTAWSNHKRDVR